MLLKRAIVTNRNHIATVFVISSPACECPETVILAIDVEDRPFGREGVRADQTVRSVVCIVHIVVSHLRSRDRANLFPFLAHT